MTLWRASCQPTPRRDHAALPHFGRQVFFDPREQEYVALCADFPYLSAFGAAATEALAELDVALEGTGAVRADEGRPLLAPNGTQAPPAARSTRLVREGPRRHGCPPVEP